METHFQCEQDAKNCVRVHQDEPLIAVDNIKIQFSVGQQGKNFFKDVEIIQRALNKVSVDQGGLAKNEKLKDDGWVGVGTIAAIERFQRRQFPDKTPDKRIDPGQRTIQRLNAVLGQAVVDRAFERDIPDAIARVRSALLRLSGLRAAVQNPSALFPMVEERRFFDWHFKLSRAADPVQPINHVAAIYTRMLTTLQESATPTSRFALFDFSDDNPNAVASAPLGGFHLPRTRGKIHLRSHGHLGSLVLIHELGHFCGDRVGSPFAILHRSHPLPFGLGSPRESGSTNYRDMSAQTALGNVYSYQCYAFPELSFCRVPDDF